MGRFPLSGKVLPRIDFAGQRIFSRRDSRLIRISKPGILTLPETGTPALPYAQEAAHLSVDEALRTMDRDRRFRARTARAYHRRTPEARHYTALNTEGPRMRPLLSDCLTASM